MEKETFERIKKENRLLFLAVCGSTSQGTAIEGVSDKDYIGVYVANEDELLGLPRFYTEELREKKNDVVWYEIGKFMNMLLTANPTVLSTLFIDDEFIEYEHPLFTELKKHRQEFVTKDCFGAFIGYAYSQIQKARGLNKKIVQTPITEHLKPLDFCYTFYKQGSTKIEHWLEHRGLFQKYCGLVSIPNMQNMYGVYYDFGAHKNNVPNWRNDTNFLDFVCGYIYPDYEYAVEWLEEQEPIGYRGIVGDSDDIYIENFVGKPKIFDIRLSPVEKGAFPICTMSYNQLGYSQHCKEYKEYQEWVANRNPVRFLENKEKEFDRKNIAHCVRLLHMGIEIATTGEVHVNRTNIDRDFILNIRRGNTTYDEIMEYVQNKLNELQENIKTTTLPEHIDVNFVNELLINIRKKIKNG